MINISRRNKTRDKVNSKCIDHFGIDVEEVPIFGRCYVGMPVIAYRTIKRKDNTETIWNSDRLFVASIQENVLRFTDGKYVSGKELGHIKPGFCTSVYKWQGCTIDEPFTIWDGNLMNLNEMYTAISRSSKLSHVHIGKRKDTYEWAFPTGAGRLLELNVTERYIGRIYMITKPGDDRCYVGVYQNDTR